MSQLLSLWPLAIPIGVVTYKVNEHRNYVDGMYAHPTVECVGKDFVRFDLTPIHPDWRSYYGPPTACVTLEGPKLTVRGVTATDCIEINQHHFWVKDLLKGELYKTCYSREKLTGMD
jgi:hypothetical protein